MPPRISFRATFSVFGGGLWYVWELNRASAGEQPWRLRPSHYCAVIRYLCRVYLQRPVDSATLLGLLPKVPFPISNPRSASGIQGGPRIWCLCRASSQFCLSLPCLASTNAEVRATLVLGIVLLLSFPLALSRHAEMQITPHLVEMRNEVDVGWWTWRLLSKVASYQNGELTGMIPGPKRALACLPAGIRAVGKMGKRRGIGAFSSNQKRIPAGQNQVRGSAHWWTTGWYLR